MSSFLAKKEGRAGQFKKTIDSEDSRRKREDSAIQIRKEKRENEINKRRHIVRTIFNGLLSHFTASLMDPPCL